MQEETNQDNQKTIVSFVVGLLIGGLLVWAFSGPSTEDRAIETEENNDSEVMMSEESDTATEEVTTITVGEGDISVPDQAASDSVTVDNATYPVSEGWIGIREYTDGELGYILGVNRFSESQGLVPENIELVRSTTPGNTYAVVVYEEDGDFDFSLAGDRQLEVIFDTFTAE